MSCQAKSSTLMENLHQSGFWIVFWMDFDHFWHIFDILWMVFDGFWMCSAGDGMRWGRLWGAKYLPRRSQPEQRDGGCNENPTRVIRDKPGIHGIRKVFASRFCVRKSVTKFCKLCFPSVLRLGILGILGIWKDVLTLWEGLCPLQGHIWGTPQLDVNYVNQHLKIHGVFPISKLLQVFNPLWLIDRPQAGKQHHADIRLGIYHLVMTNIAMENHHF